MFRRALPGGGGPSLGVVPDPRGQLPALTHGSEDPTVLTVFAKTCQASV